MSSLRGKIRSKRKGNGKAQQARLRKGGKFNRGGYILKKSVWLPRSRDRVNQIVFRKKDHPGQKKEKENAVGDDG